MMEEAGKVTEIFGDMAAVEVLNKTKCRNCPAESFCKMGKGDVRSARAINKIGAKIGDRVKIEIKESDILKCAFLVYIFPVVLFILAVAVTRYFMRSEVLSAIAGFITLGIYFTLLGSIDSNAGRSNFFMPEIKEIIEK